MDAAAPRRRPGLVTLAVVLIYIAGVVDVLLGIAAIFVRYLPEAEADGLAFPVTVLGAAMIIIGLAIIALASGVARGSRFARGAITILLLLGLVVDIVELVLDPDSGPTSLIGQAIACVIVALPLWIGPGRRFFARSPA
jgi:hypothetical protein